MKGNRANGDSRQNMNTLTHPSFSRTSETYLCCQFGPYSEYFAAHPPIQLHKGSPDYRQTLSSNNRNNLSVDRQLQYLRRVINHDYCHEATKNLIADSFYQPYQKVGSRSLVFGGKLYWSENTVIREMDISEVLNLGVGGEIQSVRMGKGRELIDFHEKILELQVFQQNLMVRSSRIVFIYSIEKAAVVQQYRMQAQIISVWFHESRKSQNIFFSLFDGIKSWITKVDRQKSQEQLRLVTSEKVVHSGWCVTEKQGVICTENQVSMLDERKMTISKILQTGKRSERIFSCIPSGLSFTNSCFFLSDSFKVKAYDLRKCSLELISLPHHCEEAPPTILNLVQYGEDSCSPQKMLDYYIQKKKDNNSILLAYSPYQLGSALLAELNPDLFQANLNSRERWINGVQPHFQLLFDRGKLDKSYHPFSVAPVWISKQLGLFHFDNFGGISFQIFASAEVKQRKAKANEIGRFVRRNIGKPIELELTDDANQEWFREQLLRKSIKESSTDFWEQFMKKEDLELEQGGKKCDERYLRYADLRKFFHEVYKQSQKNEAAQNAEKENELIRWMEQEEVEGKKAQISLEQTFGSLQQEEKRREQIELECLTLEQLGDLGLSWERD